MCRLLPILLFVLAFPACGSDQSARVIGISDGDTITVLTAEKKLVKIRLWGIDTPETGQDFGSRAKQAASELAFGKTVKILPRDTNRYGRTVAEVILPDGRSMNREMVKQGQAWWYQKYAPADAELARLEALARAAQIGLWSQPNPVAPWNWRHGEGVPQMAGVIGNRRSYLYQALANPVSLAPAQAFNLVKRLRELAG